MSIQVKNDHINGTDPFNILDFNITDTSIEGIFTGSNCVPIRQTKSTYLIQDCTTIDCTTIQCNTVQCTTVNCTTIDCTTVQCNQVQCKECTLCSDCTYDSNCNCYCNDA
jgi:hypothetical protein|nr:MAG TPA: hypothetical protein [Caudoviricetes sp.]